MLLQLTPRLPRPCLTLACRAWPCPQITAVISAHNDNTKSYNLTAIVASLNSPMDFSMYIQNFTHRVSPLGAMPGPVALVGAQVWGWCATKLAVWCCQHGEAAALHAPNVSDVAIPAFCQFDQLHRFPHITGLKHCTMGCKAILAPAPSLLPVCSPICFQLITFTTFTVDHRCSESPLTPKHHCCAGIVCVTRCTLRSFLLVRSAPWSTSSSWPLRYLTLQAVRVWGVGTIPGVILKVARDRARRVRLGPAFTPASDCQLAWVG